MPQALLFVILLFLPLLSFSQEENVDGLILKSIYFGGGSYFVTPDQADELVNFIQEFENLEHYEIVINGHTDNIGGREYNLWLSKMRSSSVYEILKDIPVPENQMKISNLGMDSPLYNNRSSLGRRANRRVDVILVPIVF